MIKHVTLIAVVLIFSVNAAEQEPAKLLKVTVYYESLCPYSIEFIVKQLYPGYLKLSSYLEIDFVPFGNAEYNNTNGTFSFKCQHGKRECYGNKIQACGLAEEVNQDKHMEYINCVMGQTNPANDQAVIQCASKLNVTPQSILSCAKGLKGDELLAKYGDRTLAIKSLIPGVPSIFLDDEYDEKISEVLTEDFFREICSIFSNKPNACPKDNDDVLVTNEV